MFLQNYFHCRNSLKEYISKDEIIPNPRTGPFANDEDVTLHHGFYKRIPFVLSLQAVMFYILSRTFFIRVYVCQRNYVSIIPASLDPSAIKRPSSGAIKCTKHSAKLNIMCYIYKN
jgi:hypothetical protein